nr:MAG TPA: hypothetical protein [Caudoviricetes sp.]
MLVRAFCLGSRSDVPSGWNLLIKKRVRAKGPQRRELFNRYQKEKRERVPPAAAALPFLLLWFIDFFFQRFHFLR